jgi:hypothetical protein
MGKKFFDFCPISKDGATGTIDIVQKNRGRPVGTRQHEHSQASTKKQKNIKQN